MPACGSCDSEDINHAQNSWDYSLVKDFLIKPISAYTRAMSGHSKWANIRVKKTAQDAKRGKVFTRHAKLIEIAARASGGDPASNPSLRTAIDNAKADSVPNMNIDRAIKKGTGENKGEAMREIIYAAMGPGGTAYLIECLTDNKNRTLSNVKMLIGKNGGSFAESGSVLWMFVRKGVVIAKTSVAEDRPSTQLSVNDPLRDELELQLIDAGAEDIDASDGIIEVTTDAAHWTKVRDLLKNQGYEIDSAGLKFVASQKVSVTDAATAKKIADFMEAVEEDEDVSEIHTNAEVSAEVMNQAS